MSTARAGGASSGTLDVGSGGAGGGAEQPGARDVNVGEVVAARLDFGGESVAGNDATLMNKEGPKNCFAKLGKIQLCKFSRSASALHGLTKTVCSF